MKNVIILIIAFVLGMNISFASNDKNTENASATTNMTGKVIDKITGETLAGVMVELDGTNKYVFSDFDGNFSFENLNTGEYSITVSLISYEKNQTRVNLSKPCEKEVKVMLETIK